MSDTQSFSEAQIAKTLNYRATQKRRASKKAYRERNAERLRQSAQLRMECDYLPILLTFSRRRRAELRESAEKAALARERRREADANHRENIRREKFVKKHGYRAYLDSYLPLLNEFNSFRLSGVKVPLSKDETGSQDSVEQDEGE
ncbi:hypothetical protein B0H16DRAFT_1467476 [Mycena metata]|uniref:Uncharacterized protein n=1 Tax=Mycena metata TaxID=1033252 RepID=A0AAD7I5S6_9AGAR|nr:hypothetical protein B0H16DRAFT_1467476 [Mycena metata]